MTRSSERAARVSWPEFFIVGAPRCGTSFLWHHLRQHPDVFMPGDKERPYFCRDLDTGTALDRKIFVDEATYLARFDDHSGHASHVGDACAYDLFSERAAQEISRRRPDARILVCVRDPLDQMRSFHNIRVAMGQEDLEFDAALDAEPERARGLHLPRNPHLVPMYQYRDVARYDKQIDRYIKTFGRDRVLVTKYEDIRSNAGVAFERVIRFLGLPEWAPDSFEFINQSVVIQHGKMLRLLTDERLIESAKRVVPRPLHGVSRKVGIALRERTWNRR